MEIISKTKSITIKFEDADTDNDILLANAMMQQLLAMLRISSNKKGGDKV